MKYILTEEEYTKLTDNRMLRMVELSFNNLCFKYLRDMGHVRCIYDINTERTFCHMCPLKHECNMEKNFDPLAMDYL